MNEGQYMKVCETNVALWHFLHILHDTPPLPQFNECFISFASV